MYKHVEDLDSREWEVIDLDTKEVLIGVQWADDSKGDYKINYYKKGCKPLSKIKKGNILIIKSNNINR